MAFQGKGKAAGADDPVETMRRIPDLRLLLAATGLPCRKPDRMRRPELALGPGGSAAHIACRNAAQMTLRMTLSWVSTAP